MAAIDWTTIKNAIWTWVVAGSGLAGDHVIWTFNKQPRPTTAPWISINVDQVRGIGHDWTTSEDNPLALADGTVSAVSTSANTLTVTSHAYVTGDGPFRLITSGVLPAPLQLATDYWIVVVDANTIQLADSYTHTGGNNVARGMGSTPNPVTVIDLTSVGSGTTTIQVTPDTVRAGQEIIRRAQGYREITLEMQCYGPEGSGITAVQIMSDVVSSMQLHLYDLDQAGVGVSDLAEAFSQDGVRVLESYRGSILEPRAVWHMTFYVASDITGFDTVIGTVDASLTVQSDGGALPAIPVHVTRS